MASRTHGEHGRIRVALVVAIALGPGGIASASPLLELLGAAGSEHPLTAVVAGRGAEVSYANPALLPDADVGFTLGVTVLASDLSVTLGDRPAGIDVPETIYDLREQLPDGTTRRLELRPLPTSALRTARTDTRESDTLGYLALSLVQPLIEGRLVVGLHALLPVSSLQTQTPFFVDEREQYFSNRLHFELYGDLLRTQALSFGLGGRPLSWLSLGAGVVLETHSTAITEIYIGDSAYQEQAQVQSEISVAATFVPHFGLAVAPLDRLRLALTLHLPTSSETDGRSDVQFWTYPYPEGQTSVIQRFRFSHGSMPLRVGFGARWSGGEPEDSWSLSATGRWTRWSAYVDRHDTRPSPAFSDALSLALGGGIDWSGHRIGLDLGWTATPVPDQTGRTNYVDNDRVGGGVSWSRDFELGPATLRAGVTLQLQRLLPRSVAKSANADRPVVDELPAAVNVRTDEPATEADGLQTNNPGYPGFASEGWLFAAGLRLGVTL